MKKKYKEYFKQLFCNKNLTILDYTDIEFDKNLIDPQKLENRNKADHEFRSPIEKLNIMINALGVSAVAKICGVKSPGYLWQVWRRHVNITDAMEFKIKIGYEKYLAKKYFYQQLGIQYDRKTRKREEEILKEARKKI